ncbi:MAG TPA: AAA family ATPase, partial [Polyangiaceae bacterium]|nr:AAA family ATPase [Polyangiaceae bacterium]
MKLVKAHVRMFRNIVDSTPVDVDPGVTCLVGKNESGKTSFLHALNRLNPTRATAVLSVPAQYPAWLEKRHRLEGKDLPAFSPVDGAFSLEPKDCAELEAKFGPACFSSNELKISRSYDGKLRFAATPFNERAAALHVAQSIASAELIRAEVDAVTTFAELTTIAANLKASGEGKPLETKAGQQLEAAVSEALGGKSFSDVFMATLTARIPKFLYFDEYANLVYSADIRRLLTAAEADLKEGELTARALLRLGGAEQDYLLNPDYERRKRELENVANSLTQDVLQYWTQNDKLRVSPDITQRVEAVAGGQQAVVHELKIRVWDDRHGLSLPFDEHSTGFRWFFSFLAAFAEYEHKEPPVIILLDEPALGLHARAQRDFLRFIEERLAKSCQVIYSTHSPFMVEPQKLERVRMVEDRGREVGSVVSSDILSTDPDTLFPLQNALGYDLVQHLLITQTNLVVEGTSDFTYLVVLSDFLKSKGRSHLDSRWSIVPVGGADLIPTFVALLGNHLDMTVLIDSRKEGNQRLSRLAADGYLATKRILTIGSLIGAKLGDIEDLFTVNDYLKLYNAAFSASLTPADLVGTDPIVNRIARHIGVPRFEHGLPADVFLRRRDEFLDHLDAQTLANFENAFE